MTYRVGCTRSDLAKLLEHLKQNHIVLLKNLKKKVDHVSLVPTEATKQKLANNYLDPSKSLDDMVRLRVFLSLLEVS